MKDLYLAIQTLRDELTKLNLDCNVIEIGFGNNYLRFTFIWDTGNGPRCTHSKITWDALAGRHEPETIIKTMLENFRQHLHDTL